MRANQTSRRRSYTTLQARKFPDGFQRCVGRTVQNLGKASGPKKLCVPTDELLRAKDDLLSEGGQSLKAWKFACDIRYLNDMILLNK